MPVHGFLGSDYLKARPDFRVIQDPFTGMEVTVVPPVTPDVALIHALQGDADGNILVDRLEDDHLLAQASQRVIASVEEVVPAGAVAETPEGLFVPGLYITALVPAPGGASPTGCRGHYAHDPVHLRQYLAAARARETFDAYLGEHVFAPPVSPRPAGV